MVTQMQRQILRSTLQVCFQSVQAPMTSKQRLPRWTHTIPINRLAVSPTDVRLELQRQYMQLSE